MAAIGHWLAFPRGHAVVIALPFGLYLAVLLLCEQRDWPRWTLLAFVVNVAIGAELHAVGITHAGADAVSGTIGALTTAWFVLRVCARPFVLDTPRSVLALALFAAGACAMIGASVEFAQEAASEQDVSIINWLIHWTGYLLGVFNAASLVLVMLQARSGWPWANAARLAEGAVLAVLLVLIVHFVFTSSLPLVFLVLLPMLWAGLRFGMLEMVLAVTLLAAMALYYTFAGMGPYAAAGYSWNESVLMVQTFLLLASVSALLLESFTTVRRRIQSELQGARDSLEAQVEMRTTALRANDERFRIARTAARIIVIDWNIQRDELAFSDSPEWLRGPLPANGKYPLFKDQVHPEDRAYFLEMRKRAIDTLEGQTVQFRIVRTDGTVLHIQSYQTMVPGPEGSAERMIAIHQDITARKQMEAELARNQQQLAESEARYRRLFVNNPLMYFTVDGAGVVVSVNPQGATQLGYCIDELIGRPVNVVFPPELHSQVDAQLAECLCEPDRVHTWEITKVRKDGEKIWVRESAVAVRDEGGALLILVMCENVTEKKQTENALRESERRLRTLLDAIPDAVSLQDGGGRYIMANAAAQKSFGLPEGQIFGRTVFDLRAKGIAELLSAEDRQAIAAPGLTRFERRSFLNADVWLEEIMAPIRDASGVVSGLVSIDRDITERKLAEMALRESGQRLRTLLDAIPDQVRLKDVQGRFVMINRAFAKSFNLQENQIIGKTIFDLRAPEIAARLHAEDKQALGSNGPVRVERPSYVHGGWREIISSPIRANNGAVSGLVSISRDITERKQAELAALREREERYRTLVEQASDIIYRTDADGHFTYFNTSAALKMLGYTKDDLIGRHYLDYVHPDYRALLEAFYRARVREGAGSGYIEFPALAKDGSAIWVGQHVNIVTEDGHVVYYQGVCRDISERVAAQRALRDSNNKLRRMSARQEELLEAERTRIAHDLHDGIGQSLNLVRIKIEAAISARDGQAGTFLRDARRTIDETSSVIRTLEFDLSPPVLRELGLAPALDWLSDEMYRLYGLRVNVSDDGEPKSLNQLCRAIAFRTVRELLINVVRHAGVLRAHVDLQRVVDSLIITVSDDGNGYDVKAVAAGLGLVSVRERLGYIGGCAVIDSVPGEGTVATLTIPLIASAQLESGN